MVESLGGGVREAEAFRIRIERSLSTRSSRHSLPVSDLMARVVPAHVSQYAGGQGGLVPFGVALSLTIPPHEHKGPSGKAESGRAF